MTDYTVEPETDASGGVLSYRVVGPGLSEEAKYRCSLLGPVQALRMANFMCSEMNAGAATTD